MKVREEDSLFRTDSSDEGNQSDSDTTEWANPQPAKPHGIKAPVGKTSNENKTKKGELDENTKNVETKDAINGDTTCNKNSPKNSLKTEDSEEETETSTQKQRKKSKKTKKRKEKKNIIMMNHH